MSSKRSLSPADAYAKRPRYAAQEDESQTRRQEQQRGLEEEEEPSAVCSQFPTMHYHARCGIQQSIAMVLAHDGFESASPEALESFTEMVEMYLKSIIEETKILAISSRREYPIPSDFEITLRRYNLPISSLKPHIKHAMTRKDTTTDYVDATLAHDNAFGTLPLLGDELSGQPDKDSKRYIPSSFPDFPSTHTYKFTPQEDTRARDSKKIREEAARNTQQGEDALRRLVRASKMRKQKEVKSLVERDSQGKERFRLWESTMKRFMGGEGRGEHAEQVEIADHSMIVNGDAPFSRKEVSRLGKRPGALSGHAL